MEVTESVLRWLQDSSVLQFGASIESQKFYLHEQDAQAFECGLRFVPLIKRIVKAVNAREQLSTPSPELKSLKDTNSTAARLYNWNILIKALDTIGLSVDSDMKALIIAGDRQIVSEVLKAMCEIESSSKQENHSIDGNKKRKKQKYLGEGALLLNDLNTNAPLSDAESTLEFLILSFCRVFNVTSKTAAGLLMQSGKILSQILSKGLKGKIEPILAWFDLVAENSDILAELVVNERNALSVVMGSIKGGLMGKDFVVVQRCCDCLVTVNSELVKRGVSAWDWFAADAYSLAFKAYDLYKEDVTIYILKLLTTVGSNNLKDIFGQMLITNYPEPIQCFNVISSFWGYISADSKAYQDIQSQGLVDYWIEFGLKEADNESSTITPTKVSALGFLCDVWVKFSKYIELHEDSANSILTLIKRACREKSRILKVICYGRLFLLLSSFSKSKNSYAAIIYKTLTFALVENYSNDRVREFLLCNFIGVMEEIQSLPVSVVLEPYIKQGQVTQKPRYNTVDFDFYVAAARHPRLTVKDAILVVDSLGKIYYSDNIFANSAEIPMVLVFGRFIESSPMREFIVKFLQLGLKVIYSRLAPRHKLPIRDIMSKEDQEEERILSYYKKLVFKLCEKLIYLGNEDLNYELKELLIVAYLDVKKITGRPLKGLRMVLDLLGDSQLMIERYQNNVNPPVSSSENSYQSRSTLSIVDSSHRRNLSLASHNRDRALSDIERVKRLKKEKEYREKSQSELRRLAEEKKRKAGQRKIMLWGDGRAESSQIVSAREMNPLIEMPFCLIEDENRESQELINCALKKFGRVLRTLFNHYASTGYKAEHFQKAPFERISEKRSLIAEGEVVRLLRDHCITSSLISTEEIRKVISWMAQKQKVKQLDFEGYSSLVYYISELVFTRPPLNISGFPSGISLFALFEQFQKSTAKVVPSSYYSEPDYGTGDKDILKILNKKLKERQDIDLPEGYKKTTEKDILITYSIPEILGVNSARKICIELLDSVLFSCLKFHILSPVVTIINTTLIRGTLTKPQIETEDKFARLGVPYNKAAYKIQPLPTYMSFSPGIKLEVAKLSTSYTNDLLLECARLLDDLLHTVDSNSFQLISRNPKPAGSIPNKAIQQKLQEQAVLQAEKQKNELKRQLHKQLLTEKLKTLRELKSDRVKEEAEQKNREKEIEDAKIRLKNENRAKEKAEIERKIREFYERKNEEEQQKLNEEGDFQRRLEEKKKKDREEFLRQAKRKLIENMNLKKESLRMQGNESQRTNEDLKKDKRKMLMAKLGQNKPPISKEKGLKEQVYLAMIDSGVVSLFNLYSQSLNATFVHCCKLFPVISNDFSLLSLNSYSKIVSLFGITPSLVSIDESVRIFKGVIKSKTGEIGLNNSEFREVLVTFALSGLKTLEKEAGKHLETYGALIGELFSWIGLPVESKKTIEILKKSANAQVLNPRDKKRNNSSVFKALAE